MLWSFSLCYGHSHYAMVILIMLWSFSLCYGHSHCTVITLIAPCHHPITNSMMPYIPLDHTILHTIPPTLHITPIANTSHSHHILCPRMSQQEARLQAVNSFLGGDLTDLLADPDFKLFFESNGEACRGTKVMKPCMIYIVGEELLICRPRKIGKKYYVKYRLPVHRVRIDNRSDLEMDASLPTTGLSLPIVIRTCGESKPQGAFQIKCVAVFADHVDFPIAPFILSFSLALTKPSNTTKRRAP